MGGRAFLEEETVSWMHGLRKAYGGIRESQSILSDLKSNGPSSAIWMDLEIVILSEISQTEKEKYCMTSPYMWNLKRNDTNALTKQKETRRLKRMNLWLPVHSAIFKMDNHPGPTV